MTRWFDRTFVFGLPQAALPGILERLRRTPARLRAILSGTAAELRTLRVAGRWSVQEHAGHLLDLEPLWMLRLEDFEQGRRALHPADLDNRRTHEAKHNARDPQELAAAFERARLALTEKADGMDAGVLAHTALHPRLQRQMSAVDHCSFVAEHDEHHLASIRRILDRLEPYPPYALELLHAVERAVPRLVQMDDELSARRPAPDRWSPREIVGHLIDSASNNHQRFIRGALQEDLAFDGYAQDDWVRLQRYHDADWAELVTLWAGFNRHLASVMAAVPEERRRSARVHHNLDRLAFGPLPIDAPATLGWFMEDYVRHLEHHLAQIFRAGT